MLRKSDENRIGKLFHGSTKVRGIKNARRIAELVGVSRREVMRYLERQGWRRYSEGSYE